MGFQGYLAGLQPNNYAACSRESAGNMQQPKQFDDAGRERRRGGKGDGYRGACPALSCAGSKSGRVIAPVIVCSSSCNYALFLVQNRPNGVNCVRNPPEPARQGRSPHLQSPRTPGAAGAGQSDARGTLSRDLHQGGLLPFPYTSFLQR